MNKVFTVAMPDIGEGVVEGEVIQWLKQLNDELRQDEPVVVVMTDKATVELPSPYPGKLIKQYYKPGDTAIKGRPLYDIELAESNEKIHVKKDSSEIKESPHKIAEQPISSTVKSSSGVTADPPTRKLAKDLNIDIETIQGTGTDGRVTKEDLLQMAASKKSSQTQVIPLDGDEEKPLIGIHSLMAKRMAESKSKIPHFSYFEQLDATRLVQLRHSFKEEAAKQGISVTYMPFIIKALSMSLHRFPKINSSFDSDNNRLILHKMHNVGIAITSKEGLIVPVLKNVQAMSLQEIIIAYDFLRRKALEGKFAPHEMKEATITISNFGVFGGGGLWATPIINYPEAAILAIARIQKLPMVKNSELVVRDALNLSWSFDHRIIDGDLAASFSHHFCTLLQNPAPLL